MAMTLGELLAQAHELLTQNPDAVDFEVVVEQESDYGWLGHPIGTEILIVNYDYNRDTYTFENPNTIYIK